MNSIIYNSADFKRSRAAYTAQCTFEYLVSLLVVDAFLAKLLSSIGISDSLTGIISSFISLAGTSANSYNITYSYVDQLFFTQAMSIKNCISGIFGFGASVLAGKLLNVVQTNGNSFLGIPLYGQQLLSVISFVFSIILIIYMKLVIEKQKVRIQ